jgi:hypothetical protein
VRLVTFLRDGRRHVGLCHPDGRHVVDLTAMLDIPDMVALIELGRDGLERAREAMRRPEAGKLELARGSFIGADPAAAALCSMT